MIANSRFVILLLSIIAQCNCQSTVYTDGSNKVEFVVAPIQPGFGSQKACAKLVAGFDPNTYDYNTSCFTRTYNERGTFMDCEVAFNDVQCTSCVACETSNDTVGYILDCFNEQPSVNTNNLCVDFTNASVQEVLVGPSFTTPFNFSTPVLRNDTNGNNNTSGNNESTSDALLLVPTFAPTVTFFPTNTGYPTYEDVQCYICGDELNEISNPNQTVLLFGWLFYCSAIQYEALSRIYNYSLNDCITIQNAGCNCTKPFTPNTIAPTPTRSLFPTITPFPTYEDKCYICGSESNEISNPNQTVLWVTDLLINCSYLQAQVLATGQFYDSNLCSNYQNLGCNCTKPFARKTFAPTPTTYVPTTSLYPTITGAPSYEDICYVCGSATKEISNPNQTVLVSDQQTLLANRVYYCSQLQEFGLKRQIDSYLCKIVQQAGCNCTTSLTTPSPTSLRLLSPTSSLHPSSQPISIPKPMNEQSVTSPTFTSNNTSSQPTGFSQPMDNPPTSTSNNTVNSTSTTSSAPQHMASGVIVMSLVFSLIRSIVYQS